MKEFALQLKLTNNRLRERRESLGMTRRAVAEAAEISPSKYGELENLKGSPLTKKGTWQPAALRLADFFKVTPGELFPDSIFDVVEPETEVKLDGEEALLLSQLPGLLLGDGASPDEALDTDEMRQRIEKALNRLPLRQEQMVRQYFGFGENEHTLAELGEWHELTGERVRSVIKNALLKMQHPAYGLKALAQKVDVIDPFEAAKTPEDKALSTKKQDVKLPIENAVFVPARAIKRYTMYLLDVRRRRLYGDDVERPEEVETCPFYVTGFAGEAVQGSLDLGRERRAWACNASELRERSKREKL